MNTVLKKQILGALCWEQKDSLKDLLLNLVYRIFLFLKPSKVFSIILFPNVFIFAGIKLALFWGGLHQVQLFPEFSGLAEKTGNDIASPDLCALPLSPRLLLLSLSFLWVRAAAAPSLASSAGAAAAFPLTSQLCPSWQPSQTLTVSPECSRLTLNLSLRAYFPSSLSCSSIISMCGDLWGALPFLPGVSHTSHLGGWGTIALVHVALIIIMIIIISGNTLMLFPYICIRLTLS